MFFNANNDARKLWRCLNTVMEKKGNMSLEKLNVDGVSLVGIDLVNYVNRHFVEAVALLTSGLSPPSSYMFLNLPVHFTWFLYPTNWYEVLSRATKGNSNPRLKGNRKGIIVKGKEFYIPILNTFPTR